MFDYEEACPISKATSVLCERWTLQIIREMAMGATRFSEFQRYLPKLSPTLLNSRLRMLEEQGIIVKRKVPEKKGFEYQLSPAGNALKPLLSELGKWGMQWVFEGMSDEQLNISTIVRDFAVAADISQLPSGDTTMQFTISDGKESVKKFVLVRDGKVQLCEENIGHDVDIYLSGTLKTFYQIWYGEIGVIEACDRGLLKVVGTPVYTRHLSKWLRTSQFAPYSRRHSC